MKIYLVQPSQLLQEAEEDECYIHGDDPSLLQANNNNKKKYQLVNYYISSNNVFRQKRSLKCHCKGSDSLLS